MACRSRSRPNAEPRVAGGAPRAAGDRILCKGDQAMPRTTDVIIIGAGQAGLAMSHCLARLGVEHVLLERGRTAERWRTERWDSLRLLTPNWMSRLPGDWSYRGADPDGF